MKRALTVRFCQLALIVLLFSGSLFAASSGVLYPGWGTTVNGYQVYFGVLLKDGYQIQTAREMSTVTYGSAELTISPNTTVVMGEPIVLACGTIIVRSGSIQINDGKSTASFPVGETVHSAASSCGNALPDAPSVSRSKQFLHFRRSTAEYTKDGAVPVAATGGVFDEHVKVRDWSFWTANAVMFGSSVAAVELTQSCLQAGACTFVPDAFHSRAAMYGAGLPAAAAVSYLTYRLKAKRYPWWFVPAALVTSGDIVVSVHAAHYSH